MGYITKVDLSKQVKLHTGTTANLGGSINLGEDLIVGQDVIFSGLTLVTGTTFKSLVIDSDGKVYNSNTGGGGSSVYNGASPATRNLNGIEIGETLTGRTYDDIIGDILAPYTAPTISSTYLNPTNSNYNQQNVTYDVTFRWVKNFGTPDFVSGQVQYQRQGDSSWNNLSTTLIVVNPTTHDASATVTVNTSGVDNRSVIFRVLFTDTNQTNISTPRTATFASYSAPSASLTLSVTPSLSGAKLLRSLSTAYQGIIGGSITRNSPNINLTEYYIQKNYSNNENDWVNITSLRPILPAGGTLPANGGTVQDNVQLTNRNFVRYRAFTYDTQVTGGQGINNSLLLNVYQPVFYGMSTASVIEDINVNNLFIVPDGTSDGRSNYTNTSSDKNINGLSFTAASNRFCVGFDNSYGNLTTFFNTGTQTNLLANTSNFIIGTKNITFLDGTMKTYRFYLYASVVVSDSYIMNIN